MIVKLTDKNIDVSKLGNKAKFLLEMKNNNFNIPSGIILNSDVYDQIINYNNISEKINKYLNELTSNNTKEISDKIQKLFSNIRFPDSLLKEIKELTSNAKKYAVRSSGIKEDLDNYSFAGQYETYLNISGINNIETKIISCYKSMFSKTLLTYLVNNEIELANLKMAVIIQEMVDSDYSGICFTINPTTGADKEMLIEVAKGLGENIVSGKVSPEQYSYNWYEETANINENNKYITPEKLVEYAKVFINIQEYFGYPCDIEFAIKNNKLYILQARKITKIKYSKIKDIWSTADFKDGGVSATICTPYMWSLYEYIWEYTLRKFILDSKILKKVDCKLGDMFYARCYWNMSLVKKAMSQVIGYKEREFDSEYGIKINYEGDGETTKATPIALFHIIQMALAQKKILNTRNNNAEKYKQELLEKYTKYKNMYDTDKIIDIKTTWYKLTKKDYLQSESTYFWQIFINTIHQSLYKDSLLKYVTESEYLSLLGSIDNISHLLPFYELWDLSRNIKCDKKSLEYWQNNTPEEILKNLNKNKYELPEMSKIIEKYGYHSDKELDVTYPCYYEQPETLIKTLKDMLLLDNKYSPLEDKKRGTEKYNELLEKIKDQTTENKYKKIKKKIEDMRKMLWWREEFRDISTKFYYIIRVYTIRLAERLHKENVIPKIDDIWYLKVADLWDFLDNKKDKKEIQKIIKKNKLYYNCYRNYMSENEIGSIITLDENSLNKNNPILKGLGANNGIVTGTARVIENFDDIDRLKENDILITKFTDTGWTPKFAILSGIVTEYGGILCHAAIVSREYGIPAIVCCHDVLKKVKDGTTITINGTTGEVIIEKENK